jgi:peptide/nickel transport system permease protein
MATYIVKRLLTVIVVLWAVVTLTFLTLHLAPGDAAHALLASTAGGESGNPAALAALQQKFQLDRPLPVQYWDWLVNLLHGNLGVSYKYDQPVVYMLEARLPNTLLLGTVAFAFALAVAIPLGMLSALRQNRFFDHATRTVTMLLSSFPEFWTAIMLIIGFSIVLGVLPVGGMDGPRSIVLPALTLSLGMIATLLRMMRSSTLDALGEDYVAVARVKGLPERAVLSRHVLRNAISPVVTVAGLQIGYIISGAVIIENIFSWPGIGGLMVDAVNTRDMPMVEGCVLLIACGYTLANLLVDIVFALIDPRVAYSGGA